jgi:hypothetical protein
MRRLGCGAQVIVFVAIVLASAWALSEIRGCQAQALKISQAVTVGLAAGDVATTWGHADMEANRIMKGVVAHPARMVAVKGAVTATQVWILHKGGKAHPRWALWSSIGFNIGQGLIVWHNWRVTR